MNSHSPHSNIHFRDSRFPVPSLGACISMIALLASSVGISACGEPNVSQYNRPPNLTSIGPISFDGNSVLVEYTLRDREGDDQSIEVDVCERSPDSPDVCGTPAEGAASDGRNFLPTVPRGEDVEHRFAWNVGCGRVWGGSCLETELDASYGFRIRLKRHDQTIDSESFRLGEEFEMESVPACDTSAGQIPEPCPPAPEEGEEGS